MKKHKIIFLLAVLITISGILVSRPFLKQNSLVRTLSQLKFQVEAKATTFRGYSSQKITATGDGKVVIAQIVNTVRKDSAEEITKELNAPIEDVMQKVVITDPYSGKAKEFSIPDSLKPTSKSVEVESKQIQYNIVYANEIYSLKIFSEEEVKYKGIYSSYYCPGENAAYGVEIYTENSAFSEQESFKLLTSLVCK